MTQCSDKVRTKESHRERDNLVVMASGNNLVGLLKLPPFKSTKIGDPQQTLQDWVKYIKQYRRFLSVTKAAGDHSEGHVNCGA